MNNNIAKMAQEPQEPQEPQEAQEPQFTSDGENTFCQNDDENNICTVHPDISRTDRFHYGMCIYCLMSRKQEWTEGWDDWAEVAERVSDLVKMGYDDYVRGIKYCSEVKTKSDNVKAFRKIYKMGQDLASSMATKV